MRYSSFDELRLFHDLGHDVYSLGSYTQPGGDEHRKRPPLPDLPYAAHFIELALQHGKENLHPEMLEGIDLVLIQHIPMWIQINWDSVLHPFIRRGGRVVWRTIGQSIAAVESILRPYRQQGLQIVRCSPTEATIPGYIGHDAVIRFYKEPSDFLPWTGDAGMVVNFTQSLAQRSDHCGLDIMTQATEALPFMVFGPNNEPLGDRNGGLLIYGEQLEALADARAYLYHGTYPASYTLSFIEAWMAGVPVVAVGNEHGNAPFFPEHRLYEVADLIEHGIDGFISDSPHGLRNHLREMLNDGDYALSIGREGRRQACKVFGMHVIAPQWEEFLS